MLTALRLIYNDYKTVYDVTTNAAVTPEDFISPLIQKINDQLAEYGVPSAITIKDVTQEWNS